MDPLSGRNIDLDFDWSVEESVAAVVEVVVVRLVFVGVLPFETLLLICQFHPEGFLICRFLDRCSMCPAIHINSRSWLRSSSTHEPSDPPPRVVFFLCLWSNLVAGNKDTTDWPAVDRRLHHRVVCYGSSS